MIFDKDCKAHHYATYIIVNVEVIMERITAGGDGSVVLNRHDRNRLEGSVSQSDALLRIQMEQRQGLNSCRAFPEQLGG